ncbi:CBS domain-containing protein [Paraliobacillus sediminis]|uniref:CBS domain-containing protein n=1 Tax=Paraliobacillus sediminis TaxID=1885916 RepID=UPI0013C37244|nr:CBS domain-containing protein [Paraliobacillus sediminis]
MKNSERFIIAFNKIEAFFDKEINEKRHLSFYRSVQLLKRSNAIVDRYQDDLIEYAELRNAIIHERTNTKYAIAEPHDDVVVRMENIEKKLTAPELVIPRFSKRMRQIQANDTLSDVLRVIHETDYSQFPVYLNKELIGLLTDKGITHWLSKHVTKNADQLFHTAVSDIIRDDDRAHNYKFINQSMSMYQAEHFFLKQIKQTKRLDALLITKNGKPEEKLLGMITTKDLIEIP